MKRGRGVAPRAGGDAGRAVAALARGRAVQDQALVDGREVLDGRRRRGDRHESRATPVLRAARQARRLRRLGHVGAARRTPRVRRELRGVRGARGRGGDGRQTPPLRSCASTTRSTPRRATTTSCPSSCAARATSPRTRSRPSARAGAGSAGTTPISRRRSSPRSPTCGVAAWRCRSPRRARTRRHRPRTRRAAPARGVKGLERVM